MSLAIRCKRDAGNKQGPDISDPLIITEAMASARGKRFLDDPAQGGHYITKRFTLGVPHRSALVYPGQWVTVTCSKVGLSAAVCKVVSYSFSQDGANPVWATMEIETYA